MIAWFVVPYKRITDPDFPGPGRYCAMDDFTAQILADGGDWDETEILGDVALVKVRASAATMTAISAAPGLFTIPTKWVDMQDDLTSMTNGERNQLSNAVKSLGYTQAELDAAMGTSLAQWRTRTLGNLLEMAATRRLKPRYDVATDTILIDGPVQPVKPVAWVNAKVK